MLGSAAAVLRPSPPERAAFARHRPEDTTLHHVVRENLQTLYAALEEQGTRLPDFVRDELEGYLGCGLLTRGFALLRCDDCRESQLVAFSCGSRGFCPSCLGRRMAETAANLVEHVLPAVPLRQWVLTLPFEHTAQCPRFVASDDPLPVAPAVRALAQGRTLHHADRPRLRALRDAGLHGRADPAMDDRRDGVQRDGHGNAAAVARCVG